MVVEERLTLAERAVGRLSLTLRKRVVNLAAIFGLLATSVRCGCSPSVFFVSIVLMSVGKVTRSSFVAD